MNTSLATRKLKLSSPLYTYPHLWFAPGSKIFTGVSVSTTESEAGLVTRAWGIVFTDPAKPQICTKIHNSFYGELFALDKLLQELESL